MAKEIKKKDIIIIGAGMAGLTAALYAGRMNLSVLVLENALIGGQIANATGIENYPGHKVIAGGDLIATVQQQAESFGAEVDEFDSIECVDLTKSPKIVETEGCIYEADVVIIATGMNRRNMYQDKVIAVMGGGNAAVDAANFLTKYASKLLLIHRSQLKADLVSQERLKKNEKATICLNTEIESLHGDGKLETVTVLDKTTGKEQEVAVDGIFVNIGVIPNTELFKGQVEMDESGRIIAGEDCRTNLPGVFAAGDVRVKEIRQLTTAAADGTTAALLAEQYLTKLRQE